MVLIARSKDGKYLGNAVHGDDAAVSTQAVSTCRCLTSWPLPYPAPASVYASGVRALNIAGIAILKAVRPPRFGGRKPAGRQRQLRRKRGRRGVLATLIRLSKSRSRDRAQYGRSECHA